MENLKRFVPRFIWDYGPIVVVSLSGILVVEKCATLITSYRSKKQLQAQMENVRKRWKDTPKDVVILHMITRGRTVPNPSPFVLKMETYLRMANIPYEVDTESPIGPTMKTPWITLNGEHMGDTHLTIAFLRKKFGRSLGNYSVEENALATMVRIMMDEYLFWGMYWWRYVNREGKDMPRIFSYPPKRVEAVRIRMFKSVKEGSWHQGIARHKEEDVFNMLKDGFRALSTFLGEKKFILGDEPCEADASVFGLLAQSIWSIPVSETPFKELFNDELPNLEEYCFRMKDKYYPDWDNLLVK